MKISSFNQLPTRDAAFRAVHPLQPGDGKTYFYGTRTNAGSELPPYYLVYFLLVDLLGYPCFGRGEKVAWSIPVQLNGQLFIVEHRKLGLGVFCRPDEVREEQAREVVRLIQKGVRAAHPFFESIAADAVSQSKVNLINQSVALFERFQFFLTQYEQVSEEARKRADEKVVESQQLGRETVTSYHFPAFELKRKGRWLALAAIDSFFSWTEHVFIHLAVLLGNIVTAAEVADLAEAEWATKFKAALGIDKQDSKIIYDDLVLIRRQLRNYMAHGAFGKQGEAFKFHSEVGAVPVLLLPKGSNAGRFTLVSEMAFDEDAAIQVIKKFITHVWSDDREPAYYYIQESGLATILTMAADGRYKAAMQSVEDMQSLIEYLHYEFDIAANMDW